MSLKYSLLLFLSFFSLSALGDSQRLKAPKKLIEAKEQTPYQVLLTRNKWGEDKLEVENTKTKKKFTYTSEINLIYVLKAEIFKIPGKGFYLYTLWHKPPHGQEVLIFDLGKMQVKPVFKYVSAWPIAGYEVEKKTLVITGYTMADRPSQKPPEERITFKP